MSTFKVEYLSVPILESRISIPPNGFAGRTQYGYTSVKGSPTRWMIIIDGRKTWRRVWVLCFSNSSSYFININGERFYLKESQMELIAIGATV